jgi:hypothetical protein
MEVEGGTSRSHSLENSVWKRRDRQILDLSTGAELHSYVPLSPGQKYDLPLHQVYYYYCAFFKSCYHNVHQIFKFEKKKSCLEKYSCSILGIMMCHTWHMYHVLPTTAFSHVLTACFSPSIRLYVKASVHQSLELQV